MGAVRLSDKQRKFIEADTRRTLLLGQRYCGKTTALLELARRRMYSGDSVLYISHSSDETYDSLKVFIDTTDRSDTSILKSKNMLEHRSGGTVKFLITSKASLSELWGHNYDVICVDNGSFIIRREGWEELLTLCDTNDAELYAAVSSLEIQFDHFDGVVYSRRTDNPEHADSSSALPYGEIRGAYEVFGHLVVSKRSSNSIDLECPICERSTDITVNNYEIDTDTYTLLYLYCYSTFADTTCERKI